jgi:mannose/fructose-specific phosphotransferase system component IIA
MAPLRPVAVLVTHGVLGTELVRTVERILGPQDDFVVVSNEGLSAEGLVAAIETALVALPQGQAAVVFSDLAAGSCGLAVRRAGSSDRVVRRITGANLPMLLEFFHYRGMVPLEDLLPRMETKGRAGIVAS